MSEGIEHVGVVGTGRMGPGIFDLVESYGFQTTFLGRRADAVEKRRLAFLKDLDFAREQEAIDEEEFHARKEKACFTTNPADLADCDLVIEAIDESATRKREFHTALDSVAKKTCIFTSCSSSIVPSEYAPSPERAARTFGLHFFYPPKVIGIVEIIRCSSCDKEVQEDLVSFCDKLDRTHFLQTEEEPFLLNRLVLPLQAEAYRFVENSRASFAQIDHLLRERFKLPQGVFSMFDGVGIGVAYPAVARYIAKQPQLTGLAGPLREVLRRLFEGGRKGMRTGAGFYDYIDGKRTGDEAPPLPADTADEIYERLRLLLINQVYYFVDRQVALESDMASALSEAFGFDVGIRQWMDGDDLQEIGSELQKLYAKTGVEAYLPNGCLVPEEDSDDPPQETETEGDSDHDDAGTDPVA